MNGSVILSLFIVLSGLVPTNSTASDKPICHPCTPFASKDIAIARSRHFYASLDPRDQRVPRVFVQTHEHVASLADWTDEQWLEFGQFARALEAALRGAFGADLVNVACLMNLAGKEGTHTHWHFIPRLPQAVDIGNPETGEQHVFEDPAYGKPYDMNSKNYRSPSAPMLYVIIKKIQKHLDMSRLPDGEHKQIKSSL